MNALKSLKHRQRQALKNEINKIQTSNCEKCLAEINRQCVTTSKYNAMFHVMHMLVVLHDKYGFGKKRLEGLLEEYAARDESFKGDLADGVAWTKTKRRLEEIGLSFSEEDDELCSKVELLFEKNVTRYEKGKKKR